MTEAARYAINEAEVVAQDFDGEVVIINLAKGLYYSIDGGGGQVWALTTRGYTVEEVAAALQNAYGIAAERARADVDHVTAEFLRHQLIVAGAAAPDVPAELAPPKHEYRAPTLGVHDDIGHLLALDPPVKALQTNLDKPAPRIE